MLIDRKIGKYVDMMIAEDELPARADIRPISRFDGLLPEEPEELEAYYDIIAFVFKRPHQLLEIIPKPKNTRDIWMVELDEIGQNISAFNTHDFDRKHPDSFSKYHWLKGKHCEVVKHMAIDHSIIKEPATRAKIRMRAFDYIRNDGKLYKEELFKIWLEYAYWD
jgi:hypothetical protein